MSSSARTPPSDDKRQIPKDFGLARKKRKLSSTQSAVTSDFPPSQSKDADNLDYNHSSPRGSSSLNTSKELQFDRPADEPPSSQSDRPPNPPKHAEVPAFQPSSSKNPPSEQRKVSASDPERAQHETDDHLDIFRFDKKAVVAFVMKHQEKSNDHAWLAGDESSRWKMAVQIRLLNSNRLENQRLEKQVLKKEVRIGRSRRLIADLQRRALQCRRIERQALVSLVSYRYTMWVTDKKSFSWMQVSICRF
jgi:hypothetical protein